ncbi:MAG: nuclear transport factor 2 family protein [Planctomycetes bacterium]|nr:nuclear transport factor 2 family protein [Planctomycetota bacterium]
MPVPATTTADSPPIAREVCHWMERFASAVRARDYAAGRAMFDPGVVAFGTVASHITHLDRLIAEQWRPVWENTSGFRFDPASITVHVAGDLAWAAAAWTSSGTHVDGGTFPRAGRATIILRRTEQGWLATHTHFSFNPSPSDSPRKP